jgi:EAL domain-containing protein (putative c-di-GMP-specific phosphodiesterase class I)
MIQSGFNAAAFSCAQSFLEMLKREPPEIVVLDLALGQSDAVEIIQHLAAVCYRGKVLLISGRDEVTLREIQSIGARRGLLMLEPLRKPFRSSALRDRLLTEPEPCHVSRIAAPSPVTSINVSEALHNNWLELWYQPKVDLISGHAIGAEVLLRARHPTHGIVLPSAFLPAPNDPLYQPISELVLRRAMDDWLRFASAGFPLKLAVNVPASVISAPGFVNLVRQSFPKDSKFPGLILEVTEDEVIHNIASIKEIFAQLKLCGASLSIDDLGTGYSSLSRLFDLSFAEVKLDRRFVSNCGSDQLKAAICRTMIDLAHCFQARVCAEGVESAEDMATLTDMKCDSAQGYFVAKPMPFELAVAYLGGPVSRPVRCTRSSELEKARLAQM